MLIIRNWSSFQSYKDRNPPWLRLHKNLLDNYEFHQMSANARALLPMLWLLASDDSDPKSGMIRIGYEAITFRLRMSTKDFQSGLRECIKAEFIIEEKQQVTDLSRNCHSETETETETETDISCNFDEFWKSYPTRQGSNPKKAAQDKFTAVVKKGIDAQEIIKGAKNYRAQMKAAGNSETQFVAQAVTWLNQERWKDDYQPKEAKNGEYCGM